MNKPGLHIEPTSRCTLRCSKCARTVMLDKFGKKSLPLTDLDFKDLDRFIDVKLDKILLCGNFGDPIYHQNFLKLLTVCKKHADRVKITTNGSYRSTRWWNEITSILTRDDEICFSIDGTPENFTQYRVNGHWGSILNGIKTCVNSSAKTSWKLIPFSFNEDSINKAKQLSTDLGIDKFIVSPSSRWEKNDFLKPNDLELVSGNYKNQKEFKLGATDFNIDPECNDNQSHYVNAKGFYVACCYAEHNSFYYKSHWWKEKEKYNIKTTTLSEQLNNFKIFYQTINKEKYNYCMFNCGKL